MRPKNLKTKIFLDSGDPDETKKAIELLGFLDGQTTNPSLIAKSPRAQERLASGKKFSPEEVSVFYKHVVQDIEKVLGSDKSISVEVAAGEKTPALAILVQARDMREWVSHVHIKIPITKEGLQAGKILASEGTELNFTLNFTQEQAAAVHAATLGAAEEAIYISPFHGRLDDINVRGQDVIDNITRMYRDGGSHVKVLSASIRDYESFLYAISNEQDIITVPLKILEEWASNDLEIPESMDTVHEHEGYESAPYKEIDLTQPWDSYDISHSLTSKGIAKFTADWEAIVEA